MVKLKSIMQVSIVSQFGEPNDHRNMHGHELSLHYSFSEATVYFDFVCDDNGKQIQIAGERIYVPVRAEYNIKHEREGDSEEIELQIKGTHEEGA